ncbi:hypothetical protein ULMS_08140 [Patiriisocius marinistellae]|uniref:Secretion system C-terminal sorting domain-containing protein n=1 Tax=Patiriisocius marinistellae TaxID=2494560 RepID=A0A5J4FYT9_9FLAO|nr:T9SS type A sorting domain-containing protein [Patiriisocius marinistellae]GEQ85306.1 hypothetical protein ULMS_08140 [Patiriisocius marinistellae]
MKALKYLIFLGLFTTFLSSYAQSHIWTQNNGDTNWSTPSNWSAGSVPDINSEVLIPDGFVVEITAAANANSIFLEGASQLIVSSNLTFQEGLDITLVAQLKYRNGTISGGIIENEGTIKFETNQQKLFSNITINNYNLLFFVDSNQVKIGNGTIINNTQNGMIEIFANGGMTREGTTAATVNNYGNIKKYSASGDLGSFYMIFDCNNYGTIEVTQDNQILFLSPQASLSNFTNGILTGNGVFDITSSFLNEGHISPAGIDNIGILHFINVFKTSAATILDIDINASENDVIEITGSVDLEGEIIVNITDTIGFETGQIFTILTTTNGINSCNFPSQIVSNDGGINDIVFNVFCDNNNLILEVETISLSTNNFLSKNKFNLYPNPAFQNENITIEASAEILNSENINIVVYDVLGKRINYKYTSTTQSTTLNMEHATPGLYFVQLLDGDKVVATQKLLVK